MKGALMDLSQRAAGLQHRSYALESHSFTDTPDGFTFDGTASTVAMPYTVRDQFGDFTETIAPGAFAKATREATLIGRDDDVFLYVNHRSTDVPMARLSAGTLKLSADPHLRAVATLDPARPDVQIVRSAVTRGELTDMSIGFTVNKGRDSWNSDYTERTIHEVNLKEVSIVAVGANPFTSASMRSLDEWLQSLSDIDASASDLKRAERAIQLRFSDLFAGDVRTMLRTALSKFATKDQYLYVEDHTDAVVVFDVNGELYRIGYSLVDGKVELADALPEPVSRASSYVKRSADPTFADRDRADMDRLLQIVATKPVF